MHRVGTAYRPYRPTRDATRKRAADGVIGMGLRIGATTKQ